MAIIPSVVSIPPNSSTAAFETTCSVVRSSSHAAAPSNDASGPLAITSSSRSRSESNASPPRIGRSCPAVTSVTAATIASYQPSIVPTSSWSSPSARAMIDAASGPANDRRSSAAPSSAKLSIRRSASSVAAGAKRSRTARGRNGAANGARWRECASPSRLSMLGPTTCAVEKRGSSTVNVSASRITWTVRS